MTVLQDGNGRTFEVVEGELEQGEQYALAWQDIEPQIAALEVSGVTRADALTAALGAAGRKSVFVRRIPNAVDPGPSDGVSRVYLWNTDGTGPRPGFLMRALERPNTGFYERRRTEAETLIADAQAASDEARVALTAVQAELAGAKTLDEYRAAIDAGRLEEQARLMSIVDRTSVVVGQADSSIAEATAAIAALDALGAQDGGHSVEAVSAKIAETRAVSG